MEIESLLNRDEFLAALKIYQMKHGQITFDQEHTSRAVAEYIAKSKDGIDARILRRKLDRDTIRKIVEEYFNCLQQHCTK